MPPLTLSSKRKINKLINNKVTQYINKAERKPDKTSKNPFVMALLNDFDPLMHNIHGLKTALGNELEKVAEIIAYDAWGQKNVHRNVKVAVELPKNVFNRIQNIINDLRDKKNLSNYYNEKKDILKTCKNPSKTSVVSQYEFDIIIYDNSNKHLYVLEMKGPDPNTTEVPGAKQRLLVAQAWGYLQHNLQMDVDVRLALYYNNKAPKPYSNYKVFSYFNPDGGLLVHELFWNFIGKNDTTYSDLLKIFKIYGQKNKKRIWDGFSNLINI